MNRRDNILVLTAIITTFVVTAGTLFGVYQWHDDNNRVLVEKRSHLLKRANDARTLFYSLDIRNETILKQLKKLPLATHIRSDDEWVPSPELTKKIIKMKKEMIPRFEGIIDTFSAHVRDVDEISNKYGNYRDDVSLLEIEEKTVEIEKMYDHAKSLDSNEPSSRINLLPFDYLVVDEDGVIIEKHIE